MTLAATQRIGDWWAQPRGDTAAAWVANYQQSVEAPHRTAIVEALEPFHPETLLEIGAHCGPNLVRLAREYPGLEAIGIDVSAEAVAAGRQWLAAQGLTDRMTLVVGRMPEALLPLPTGAFDVVLACYSLSYLAPSDLDAVLYEMGRLATQAVVIAEPMATETQQAGQYGSLTGYHEWQHDYRDRSRWIGSLANARVDMRALVPPVERLNGLIVFDKTTTSSSPSS